MWTTAQGHETGECFSYQNSVSEINTLKGGEVYGLTDSEFWSRGHCSQEHKDKNVAGRKKQSDCKERGGEAGRPNLFLMLSVSVALEALLLSSVFTQNNFCC